jgi:membrane protease YdiL (CAAX protease family)
MSENIPLTPIGNKIPGTRSRLTIDPLLIDLGKLFLMFLLYGLILMMPIFILKRTGYDQSAWAAFLEFAMYCGVQVLTIRYALKKFPDVRLNMVFRASSVSLVQISSAVIIGVLALGLILEQSNFFLEDPISHLLKKDFFTFLSVVVAAPILEEVFCRGVVLKYLLGKTSARMAIFYSALFFSLLHMNLYQGIPVFFIGLFLGWLFYRTNSIWPGVIAHFVNNMLSFGMFVYFPQNKQNFLEILGVPEYLALIVVSILAFVFCCRMIWLKTASTSPSPA